MTRLDGKKELDQGIGTPTTANLVPTDKNGIAYSRDPSRCSTSST